MLNRHTVSLGPLACNCTFLWDAASRQAFVIDPGDEAPRILSALDQRGLTVAAILHTHCHIDHIGATAALAEACRAPVYWHQEEDVCVEALPMQAQWLGLKAPPMPRRTHTLTHQLILRLGQSDIEVRHTPGHSPGSCLFFLPAEALCITGDTLFAHGARGRTDLPGGSAQTLSQSLRLHLAPLADETLLVPGHGPLTKMAKERPLHPELAALSVSVSNVVTLR